MKPLLEHLPIFYHTSPEVGIYQGAYDPEVEGMHAERDDYFAQLVVGTATWGLARWWEPMLGIKADPSQNLDYRRSMVKAKLRGHGTATVTLIQNTVASFFDGEIAVIVSPAQFRFTIRLGGKDLSDFMRDVPALRQILDEIKPAHLAYEIIGIIDAAIFHNPMAFHLPTLEIGITLSNFTPCITFDGRQVYDGTWAYNQTRRGTLMLDTLEVSAAIPNPHTLRGTLVRDNLFCFDGSWTYDGSKTYDAYYTEEELA